MPREFWSGRYAIGVRSMDDQHRVLFSILGQLHDSMERDVDRVALDAPLRELVAYTRTHFAAEEALLASHHYPALDAHRAAHARLLRQIGRYVVRFSEGERHFARELAQFLENWLTGHIQSADRRYADHILLSRPG